MSHLLCTGLPEFLFLTNFLTLPINYKVLRKKWQSTAAKNSDSGGKCIFLPCAHNTMNTTLKVLGAFWSLCVLIGGSGHLFTGLVRRWRDIICRSLNVNWSFMIISKYNVFLLVDINLIIVSPRRAWQLKDIHSFDLQQSTLWTCFKMLVNAWNLRQNSLYILWFLLDSFLTWQRTISWLFLVICISTHHLSYAFRWL